MKFNKHGLVILYKEPVYETFRGTLATPRVFHSDVHFGHLHHMPSVSILGSRGAGKSMLSRNILRDIWNEIQ